MRLEAMPGWVVDNETSVREEAAPYVRMTMAQRWEATRRCCEAASAMLRFNRDPAAVRAHRDPLPPSTVDMLGQDDERAATWERVSHLPSSSDG